MNRYLAFLLPAGAASMTGFIIHVGSQSPVQTWVSARMRGRQATASWDVRYIALATSLEAGIGVVILYALIRKRLPARSPVVRGILLALLLLAAQGRLLRQPLMDLVIGNPLSVVLVQDGITWVVWLAVCLVTAVTFDCLRGELS